ncbi:hypothetical protein MRB53_024370 [Persea americana]|uniref:Uncharacterized protein n=1 Tax=Persea americana TaxID=3435 RepID=A0ACC2LC08_PERAE|nr:hypothetical protein MRB53_024370 [Persea americana]|eukprot:TRINITY_DN3376_c0_g1_i1.p1 TRINITY_DN3376_c0_g1~~TRINITY_DN3376_c0_g1_i1.p1  ORF type:complete len:182 (-),score=38.17 TRINITY_DN3376_c0_g1_i1:680-1225(-)
MAETITTNKRPRVDSDGRTESPEAKRIRESLIDILDDESGDRDDATQDLAFFMKSFEEEISLSPSNSLPTPSLAAPDSAESQPELGFLLEASDDELGLPPTSSGVEDEKEGVVDVFRGVSEAVGFDPIWGFGDEIMGSGFGFGFSVEEEEPVIFGGLFDDPDAVYGSSSEFSWRTESLPAL